jgi:hypothetical protein
MSEKASHHLPAKIALVTGMAAAALHPESLAHNTPEEALQAPQPAVGLPHETLNPSLHPISNHPHHHQAPVPKPTDVPVVTTHSNHENKQVTPAVTNEHWTSRKPAPMPILKHPGGETPPPPEQLHNLHPENLSVPADVSEVMHRDVAYLPALGCSGFLIRNQAGDPIGVETAQHCNLLAKDGHWDVSQPDQVTLKFAGPLNVETGDNLKDLSNVGEISQFILNYPKDNTHDQAIGVLAGQNAEDVYTAFQQAHLSIEEIGQLKTGDVIYNSGWPVSQPKNPGILERQEFAMHVLGTVNWGVTNGEQLNLLLAAVPESKDGAECSWGNSGSEAFVLKTVTLPDGTTQQVPYAIGTASAFNDFGLLYNQKDPKAAAAEKEYIENTFGVSMDGYAAVCGFAYEVPTAENNMVIANVNDNSQEIEQHLAVIRAMEDKLEEQFSDPSAIRNVIHGLVEVPGKEPYWVKDPTYAYDADSQTMVIAFAQSAEGDGGFGTWVFDGVTGLQDGLVYSLDGQTPPDITTISNGPLTPGIQVNDGFTDPSGLVIGQMLGSDIKVAGTPYIFSAEGGQLNLYPEVGK